MKFNKAKIITKKHIIHKTTINLYICRTNQKHVRKTAQKAINKETTIYKKPFGYFE
jgi:hypothetical protein